MVEPLDSPARGRRGGARRGDVALLALLSLLAGCPLPAMLRSDPPAAPPAGAAPAPLPEGEAPAAAPVVVAVEGPEMITIPGGAFTRGAEGGREDEQPVRSIVLQAFDIDRTEVDVAAYAACVEAGKCKAVADGPGCNAGKPGREHNPINCVTWVQANAYCAWRDKRLPTESEWEKAARSAGTRLYVWGDAWPPPPSAGNFADVAVQRVRPYWTTIERYDDGAANTVVVDAPVLATAQGGLHFAGNVAEWVDDWYDAKAYASGPAVDPPGPRHGKARVLRGGSFGHGTADDLRATRRMFYEPDHASMHFGVRCARSMSPPAKGK